MALFLSGGNPGFPEVRQALTFSLEFESLQPDAAFQLISRETACSARQCLLYAPALLRRARRGCEEPQLDQFGLERVFRGEFFDGFVNAEQFIRRGFRSVAMDSMPTPSCGPPRLRRCLRRADARECAAWLPRLRSRSVFNSPIDDSPGIHESTLRERERWPGECVQRVARPFSPPPTGAGCRRPGASTDRPPAGSLASIALSNWVTSNILASVG